MGVYSGNRTLLGESIVGVGEGHIMEMVLESQRNDMNMFNAVIGCDFVEAYAEAGLTTLTEEDVSGAKDETKKGIGKKIKELFAKAIENIKKFAATFIAKIKNLFSNDKALIKKYLTNFQTNGKGYKMEGWRPLLKDIDTVCAEAMKAVEDLHGANAIGDSADKEAIEKAIADYKKAIKEFDYTAEVESKFFGDKAEEHELTDAEVTIIVKTMKDSSRAIKGIKNAEANAINAIKNTQNAIKVDKAINASDEAAVARLNGQYTLANMQIRHVSKMTNVVCNTAARFLAAARRAFVAAGKQATGAQTNSAVMDYVLGEASDAYVESVLLGL